MTGIYYGGFFGPRRFNKRYDGLDEENAQEPDEPANTYRSDD